MEGMDVVPQPTRRDLTSSLWRTPPLLALTSPFTYSLVIPFALADLWISLYQAVCFRVHRIEQVSRRDCFALDRAPLPYLNALEKLNYLYWSYVNGVIAFVGEVAARTDQYWRPIKNDEAPAGAHERHDGFSRYGDASDLALRWEDLLGEFHTPSPPRTVTQAVRPAP